MTWLNPELETPAAVVDMGRVRRNARAVVDYCSAHGLSWRPHIKTHKSPAIARIQLQAGARGLTVATPREAEVMCGVSTDLLLAYPPIGSSKLERLMTLPDEVQLTVGLDSLEALAPLAAAAHARGREVGVLVEADLGMHRVGLPEPASVVQVATAATEMAGVVYRGVMFYPGNIRKHTSNQDEDLVRLANRLQGLLATLGEAGLSPQVVSGGSTPTLWRSHELPGLTEIRPGTCIFNDRDILALGACTEEELAYSVLATVVSTSVPGQAVVDAGSKALSKEGIRSGGGGYGLVVGHPEVAIRGLSEEHGVLDIRDSTWRPVVGERVRIVPNHVCLSVNLQDRLWATENRHTSPIELPARGRGIFSPST